MFIKLFVQLAVVGAALCSITPIPSEFLRVATLFLSSTVTRSLKTSLSLPMGNIVSRMPRRVSFGMPSSSVLVCGDVTFLSIIRSDQRLLDPGTPVSRPQRFQTPSNRILFQVIVQTLNKPTTSNQQVSCNVTLSLVNTLLINVNSSCSGHSPVMATPALWREIRPSLPFLWIAL